MDEMLSIITTRKDKPLVRIRGIYATALTKIFLDNGFEIVQPSPEIVERFNLESSFLSPHIDIWDKENKQGIKMEIFPQFKDDVIDLLYEKLGVIVVRYEKFQVGSVYKGVIYRPAPWGGFIVKLTPNSEGILPENELEFKRLNIGDTVVVEVKNPRSSHGYPLLSTKISVPGDLAVLIPEETVRISHKIKGPIRSKLLEIGQIIRPDGWGIIWRTSAQYVDLDVLKEEIELLNREVEKLNHFVEKAPALTKIRNGLDNVEIEFSQIAKKNLDDIRSKVLPTVDGHHQYKAFSNALTEIVDFSEKILAKNIDVKELSGSIKEYILKYKFPKPGDLIKIQHVKINGREIILGPAKLVITKMVNGSTELIMYRRFKPGGYYDGIEAIKEVGDYGITMAKLEDDKLITAYFDINNRLKGIYLNLNTPIEIYGSNLRYIDLEIDVVVNVNGEVKILDTQKLEDYSKNRNISENLLKMTKEKAKEYEQWLLNGGVRIIKEKCDEVISKLETEEEEEINGFI